MLGWCVTRVHSVSYIVHSCIVYILCVVSPWVFLYPINSCSASVLLVCILDNDL